VDRLKKIFELMEKKPRGKKCDAILGIIAEGQEVIDEVSDDAVRDAGLVGAAQAAEHYEIARYATLIAWAELLGVEEAVELLSTTRRGEERKPAADDDRRERRQRSRDRASTAGGGIAGLTVSACMVVHKINWGGSACAGPFRRRYSMKVNSAKPPVPPFALGRSTRSSRMTGLRYCAERH
jgi:hypothetical protein